MYFYITLILAVLFAQYASEMRRVPQTLTARQETWVYQIFTFMQYLFNTVRDMINQDETTEETNDSNN